VWIGLVLAGVVVAAPGWWWRSVRGVGVEVGRHWAVVLLIGARLFGLGSRAVAWWRQRWRPGAIRRHRTPVAERVPLYAHVGLLLTVAVGIAVVVGGLLWLALGHPTLAISGASAPNVAGGTSAVERSGWTVQDTFDAMKIVLSVVAGIGGAVALTVAYRRQEHGEAAEVRENTKLFYERFGRAADQLGSDRAAVRLAGVYATAGLADDWQDGRQTCIDVLCGYLRMPYPVAASAPASEGPSSEEQSTDPDTEVTTIVAKADDRGPGEERQVRHTVMRLIRDHLRPADTYDGPRWHGHHFDLTGAVLDEGNLSGISLQAGTTINFTQATFSGRVSFDGATFSGGRVSFEFATFSGGQVSFSNAKFFEGQVSFKGTTFSGGQVYFDYAKLTSARVYFNSVVFSGGPAGTRPRPAGAACRAGCRRSGSPSSAR
jgi:hypothetical protein